MKTNWLFPISTLLVMVGLLPTPAAGVVEIVFQDGFDTRYGFEVQTPSITLQPSQAASFCYYTRTPNTSALGIRRWFSEFGPGIHHIIVYTNSYDVQPAGTLTQYPCGINAVTANGYSALVYLAHDRAQDLVFPSNDGNGLPLSMEIAANQPLVIEMFGVNPTSSPVSASVRLKAEALNPATAYTRSATYRTENVTFSIPPSSANVVAQKTCAVPIGSKFWHLSTRTHGFAIQSEIKDGSSQLVLTTDWEHPAATEFHTPPFYSFSSSGLTYRCVYSNPSGVTLNPGDNELTDETCMGIGYFFPAVSGPKACFNSSGPF